MLSLTRYESEVIGQSCHFVVVQARDMVGLVNKFAAKLEEKKGSLTEDEVGVHVCCCHGN